MHLHGHVFKSLCSCEVIVGAPGHAGSESEQFLYTQVQGADVFEVSEVPSQHTSPYEFLY